MTIGNNLGTSIKYEKAKCLAISHLAFYFVPRPGLEPGWIAPLVFETSASTNSAIWASIEERSACKCTMKSRNNKKYEEKSKKNEEKSKKNNGIINKKT